MRAFLNTELILNIEEQSGLRGKNNIYKEGADPQTLKPVHSRSGLLCEVGTGNNMYRVRAFGMRQVHGLELKVYFLDGLLSDPLLVNGDRTLKVRRMPPSAIKRPAIQTGKRRFTPVADRELRFLMPAPSDL